MVCIYCGNKTHVVNSRPQIRLHQVWRRRTCLVCKATFTTLEAVDFNTSMVVRHKDGSISPFSRDTLFVSILQAVGHRQSPVEDASALTATIQGKLIHSAKSASVEATAITDTAFAVLNRFDKAASVQYAAYHKY